MAKDRMPSYSILFENLANILLQHAPVTDPDLITEGVHVAQPFWEPGDADNIHFATETSCVQ